MGSISSHCGGLDGGLCGAGVESGPLDSLHLLYYSSLWVAFVYEMMILILIMHTTGSPGREKEGGKFTGGC